MDNASVLSANFTLMLHLRTHLVILFHNFDWNFDHSRLIRLFRHTKSREKWNLVGKRPPKKLDYSSFIFVFLKTRRNSQTRPAHRHPNNTTFLVNPRQWLCYLNNGKQARELRRPNPNVRQDPSTWSWKCGTINWISRFESRTSINLL